MRAILILKRICSMKKEIGHLKMPFESTQCLNDIFVLVVSCMHVFVVYEPKMVAHICFMFRIYLELQLSSLLKQLKVLKRVRLGVELCFRP